MGPDADQGAHPGFFRYRNLLEQNSEKLTALIAEENGKTWDEAKAEVDKSIELTEFACSMPQLVSNEVLEVSRGVECRTEHFPVVEGKEGGTYVGPTVIDYVTPDMSVATEEIFGPVISIMRTDTIDEALKIENANPYGNAAAVFTQSGGLARYVMEHASAGMIGVNIGVPVPREPFSFGGWNDSRFGASDITGKSSIPFWTKLKKTTTKWNPEAGINWMSLRNNEKVQNYRNRTQYSALCCTDLSIAACDCSNSGRNGRAEI